MVKREVFEEWLENPTTSAVLKGLRAHADLTREMLSSRIWNSGYMSPEEQCEIAANKAAVVIHTDLSEMTYEDYINLIKEEIEDES